NWRSRSRSANRSEVGRPCGQWCELSPPSEPCPLPARHLSSVLRGTEETLDPAADALQPIAERRVIDEVGPGRGRPAQSRHLQVDALISDFGGQERREDLLVDVHRQVPKRPRDQLLEFVERTEAAEAEQMNALANVCNTAEVLRPAPVDVEDRQPPL